MDKGELIELIYEYANENNYDKRFVPFMQLYFTKCVQTYNWNKEKLIEKLDEYTNRIKNIEFLNIGRQRIQVDVDNNTILIDERIKYNKEDYTIDEYIIASYVEQNKILNTEISIETSEISNNMRNEIRHKVKLYDRELAESKVILEILNLVQQKNYKPKFIPFIKEYFLRSAEIYNWNRDELKKKINNFKNNVDDIEFKKMKHKCTEFNAEDKKIYINKNLLTYTNNLIIKNIFRAQGFATNYTKIDDKVYENGLYTNAEQNHKERDLNIYAEEIAANYLTGRVPYSNELYTTCRVSQKERNDYNSKTAYVASMLAAGFGINEFEIAILKDKGRARFDEYFRARFEYMDTKKYIDEFFDIVYNIETAPNSMFSTKEESIQYAKMYNLAMNILNERLNFESSNLENEEKAEFKAKSNYMKYKIVNTLKQARRNQSLEWKYIEEIAEDKATIKKYYRISKISQYKYKKVAQQLYSGNDTLFDNTELITTIITEFKFPILGKILNRKKNVLLIKSSNEYEIDSLSEDKNNLQNQEIIVPQKEIFDFTDKLNIENFSNKENT